MEDKLMHQAHFEMNDMNEKLRREAMRGMEACGQRAMTDLDDMSTGERAKWLFWNLHENLEELRKLEPTLVAQVMSTQFTVSDGQSSWSDRNGLEKRLELQCKWELQLTYPSYQSEKIVGLGEGWANLFVCDEPPSHPMLSPQQRGYLDADSSLFPNQLFLHGWLRDAVWQELKSRFYSANPACRTSLVLLDSYLFPVNPRYDFVSGPVGAVGFTNMEFQVLSHATERRLTRRSEPHQRS